MNSKKNQCKSYLIVCIILIFQNLRASELAFPDVVKEDKANELEFPRGKAVKPGDTVSEIMGCFTHDDLVWIGGYQAVCDSYRQEATDCNERVSKVVNTTPWYASKVFWLIAGVGVGLGGGVYLRSH